MRSIAMSVFSAQASDVSRVQRRVLLLIVALVVILALASLYFGVVSGPLSSHGVSAPAAPHLIAEYCGGTAAPC